MQNLKRQGEKETKMGFLTTFTVYKDSLHSELGEANAPEFCRRLRDHASGLDKTADSGNVIMQQSRQADDPTIYVHMGNIVTEMSPYSPETQESMKRNPEFFEKRLKYLRRQVTELGRIFKETKVKPSEYGHRL